MKQLVPILAVLFAAVISPRIAAQNADAAQHPTLITRSLDVVEVPSIAEQTANGTLKLSVDLPREVNPKRWGHNAIDPRAARPVGPDPLEEKQANAPQWPGRAPLLTFQAASATATPTDPTGAVGPNHFMNSWNSSFRIWDKAGNALTAAASLGTIFPGTLGDPIVLYDPFADRFLISEFFEDGFDVAISKGPNPVTSGWYVYRFPTSSFPDYPKFSVWSDGYYITANKDQSSPTTSQVVFALERDKMIAGNTSVQMLGFPLPGIVISGFYSPLGFNANGPTPPPAGNAPIVYMQDNAWSGVTTDHLKVWNINVNWTTPASSTISSPQILNTTPFDGLFDAGNFVNLPQLGGSDIDALQATIMYMAQYHRFATHNSAVFNFVVDCSVNNTDDTAAVRWYELRQTADGQPWSIYQEGTYKQPNKYSAFCGNMCMDINGNIGLAYTVTSPSQYPSLRFTGRYASDPPGVMTLTEQVIFQGTSANPATRYGDYSQMTLDPSDYSKMWSIGEVFSSGRKNYVGVFQIAPPPLTAQFTGSPTTICTGGSVTFTDQSISGPTAWTWSFPGGTPSSFAGQNPPPVTYSAPGTYDVTLTVTNGTGSDSEVKTGYITVKSVVADFTGTPLTVVQGNTVTFTDNSSCGPLTWNWSFPGGSPSSYSGQTPPPVAYSTVGTYNVSLTVTNASGSDVKTRTGYVQVVAPVFNMTNGTVTTCTGDFYDSGGPSASYQNSETYILTFYPSTPGAMIRFNFTSFSTELNYDTLTIYNGINPAAPLIGRYHGTTGPGSVTANNASGALTFRFHSDGYLTAAGWAATISCVSGIIVDPAFLSAAPVSTDQINLTWGKNPSNQDVMVAWSASSTFGTPVNGTVYSPGNPIAGGGTVLYRGPLTAFSHTGLSTNTGYYYKAFSYNSGNEYSTGLTAYALTMCGITALPLTESFATSSLPGCWTKQFSGTGAVDKWTVSNTANAGGAAYEMKSAWQSVNPGITRLVTPPINTVGVPFLNLSFRHMLDAYATGCTLRVQSSTNGTTWTNEAWSIASTSSNVGPVVINTTVANNMNSPNTLIAFTIEGDLYQYDNWYVDNVSVTSGCTSNNPVSISISVPSTTVCTGTPVTFTATPVNGGTVPAYQWQVNGTNMSVGTNSTYTHVPANNDAVTCVLTSNASCITGNPAISNTLTMTVEPAVTASVSITASANPVETGSTVTFTAAPVNGGANPVFQWIVNGSPAGTNSQEYTYIPFDEDVITCVMTSNASCVSGSPATSNTIHMSVVQPIPASVSLQNITVTSSQCFEAQQTILVAGGGAFFLVDIGGQATMIAGESIIYYPGTQVVEGGYLIGRISPGGPWCSSPGDHLLAGVAEARVSTGFFRVYPNPTSGQFTLEPTGPSFDGVVRVEIFDMQGQGIWWEEFSENGSHRLNLAGRPAGIYLLRVVSGNQSGYARIVKVQ